MRSAFTRPMALLVAAALSSLLMAACGGTVESESEQSATDIDPAITEALEKEGPVRIWDNGIVETSVQAHLLKEIITAAGGEVGMYNIDPGLGMPEMCKSDDLLTSDIWRWQNEEAWQEYVVRDKCIVDAGTTKYKGEEGWYVPTYVIEGDPERDIEPMCPELPDWEALNKCVEVFKTANTEPKGQFMTGAKSWQQWYGDPQRIENLNLDYEIAFAGGEAALYAEITRTYEQGEPWLGLMWRPNYIMYKYDMTRVEFPPHTEECWGTTYACQWPDTVIYKIASDGIAKNHPTVWKLLQNYEISDEQLFELQTMVLEDGMTPEEAAKAWFDDNPEAWTGWLEA